MKEILLKIVLADKVSEEQYLKMIQSGDVFDEFDKYVSKVKERIEVMGFKVVKLELTK